jgi:hypothetical protein
MSSNPKLVLLCLLTTGFLMACSGSNSSSTDSNSGTSTTGAELVLPSQLEVITRED